MIEVNDKDYIALINHVSHLHDIIHDKEEKLKEMASALSILVDKYGVLREECDDLSMRVKQLESNNRNIKRWRFWR